jgi:hypothetical protein
VRTRYLAMLVVPLAAAVGCSGPRRAETGAVLIEKGDVQVIVDPRGAPLRALEDADHNGIADRVTSFHANGRPRLIEIDADLDGAVDRWERYSADGALEEVAIDGDGDGRPDRWRVPGAAGVVEQIDTDGDGRPDRVIRYRPDGSVAGVDVLR